MKNFKVSSAVRFQKFLTVFVSDSKTLTEKERTQMFEKISDYNIGWYATVLSPIFISNSMLKR